MVSWIYLAGALITLRYVGGWAWHDPSWKRAQNAERILVTLMMGTLAAVTWPLVTVSLAIRYGWKSLESADKLESVVTFFFPPPPKFESRSDKRKRLLDERETRIIKLEHEAGIR